MASFKKIARRTFLLTSAAILGGVAFGVYQVNKPLKNPLTLAEGEATLNPFILIDQQGVTIITPRAEMGQGVQTTLAALAAEELDIAWEDVRVLHGPPAAAYYNAALLESGLPFADYAMTPFQRGLARQVAKVNHALGIQITGGSTSMRDGYDRLRQAGASAREALKQAAANRLGVPIDQLKTEAGAVVAPDGTRLHYPALAEDAAKLEARDVPLRPKSEWRYLGTSMPRLDQREKATGTALFGIDVRLPDMKFATVRTNPRLGGRMLSHDATEALKMPGVEKVVALDNGFAVVASNTWLAFQAADAVVVEWEEAHYPADSDGIFAAIAASFDDKPNTTLRDDGDVSATIPGGTEISADYSVPFLAHATMEPMNATAFFDGAELVLWCGNQAPTVVQWRAAEAVGIEPEKVTLHTTYLGGGFGRRGEFDFAVLAARVAKALQGTPVQVTWTREEDMTHDFYRPAALARYRGVVKDGKAVLLEGAVAGPSVSVSAGARLTGFTPAGPDKVHVEGAFDQPYNIANYRIRGHLTPLKMPIGFWRSVGASVNGFLHESFIDELAHAAGADPMEFRLDHMRGVHAPSTAVLEEVKTLSGWTGQTPDGVGRGVAFTYSFGCPVAQVIEVVDENGTIRIARAWIVADVGTALDPRNIEGQLVGAMIYGLSAAAFGQITFADGKVEQQNFPDYDALRMATTPITEVKILETQEHLTGIGEPGTPPSMPALANALFDLTGERARRLPLNKTFNLMV